MSEIVSRLTLSSSGYVLNPESPSSIMNEPIPVVSMLFDWYCYEKATDVYNAVYFNRPSM